MGHSVNNVVTMDLWLGAASREANEFLKVCFHLPCILEFPRPFFCATCCSFPAVRVHKFPDFTTAQSCGIFSKNC